MPTVASAPSGVAGTQWGPLVLNQRKEWVTVGQYAPNHPGYTRATMVGTMGIDPERGRKSPKPNLSSDWGLQLAPMKMESIVIATQNVAVNTSLLLAHTARQTTRVWLR
jgi:hypothetical protein